MGHCRGSSGVSAACTGDTDVQSRMSTCAPNCCKLVNQTWADDTLLLKRLAPRTIVFGRRVRLSVMRCRGSLRWLPTTSCCQVPHRWSPQACIAESTWSLLLTRSVDPKCVPSQNHLRKWCHLTSRAAGAAGPGAAAPPECNGHTGEICPAAAGPPERDRDLCVICKQEDASCGFLHGASVHRCACKCARSAFHFPLIRFEHAAAPICMSLIACASAGWSATPMGNDVASSIFCDGRYLLKHGTGPRSLQGIDRSMCRLSVVRRPASRN